MVDTETHSHCSQKILRSSKIKITTISAFWGGGSYLEWNPWMLHWAAPLPLPPPFNFIWRHSLSCTGWTQTGNQPSGAVITVHTIASGSLRIFYVLNVKEYDKDCKGLRSLRQNLLWVWEAPSAAEGRTGRFVGRVGHFTAGLLGTWWGDPASAASSRAGKEKPGHPRRRWWGTQSSCTRHRNLTRKGGKLCGCQIRANSGCDHKIVIMLVPRGQTKDTD